MKKLVYAFLILPLFISFHSFAQDVLVIDEIKADGYLLDGSYIAVFEDSTNHLPVTEVLSKSFAVNFHPHKGTGAAKMPYIINPGSTYWLKVKIKSDGQLHRHYVLENCDLHIGSFELFKTDSSTTNAIAVEKAGFAVPFDIRAYPHKNFVFDIAPHTGISTYYARIKSENHNPFIIKVKSTQAFTHYALNEYYLLGMFYGIIAIMALYNLLLYFSFRDKLYIQYVFYVACCALISFGEDGTGFQYIWPGMPALNDIVSLIAPLLLMVSFVIYSKSFLELKTTLPHINSALNILVYLYIGFFVINRAFFHFTLGIEIYLIPFLLIYIVSVMCLQKGLRQARYYIVGYSFMVISIILLVLRTGGLMRWDNIIIVYSFNIGLVFEIVILSFALGDRIKVIRVQREQAQQGLIDQLKYNEQLKDRANQELEEKVKERTRDLDEKNQELEEAYDEINRMNELLNADNKVLKTNVKELATARVLMKDVNFEEFSKIFPDKDSCLKYLENLKWAKGYECKKCGNLKSCEGKEEYSKRCTKCRYDESPTAYTIFHKLKFPINKAFYMLFLVYANKDKITSLELSQILSLRQSTCWNFNKKVQEVLRSRKNSGENEIDGWSQLVLEPGIH